MNGRRYLTMGRRSPSRACSFLGVPIAQLFKTAKEPMDSSRRQASSTNSRCKQILINALSLGPLGLEVNDPNPAGHRLIQPGSL